jgi:acetolactate synthase-1/3 small subunit
MPSTAPDEAQTAAPERLRVISVVVENKPGVLSKVSGMIRRRGFNIQGLSVGTTNRPNCSRMTITVDAGHAEVDQVEKQLDRVIEVVEIEDLTEQAKLIREMVLIKLEVQGERRREAMTLVERVGGRVIDQAPDRVLVELSGEQSGMDALLREFTPYGVLELARSGPVAMSMA